MTQLNLNLSFFANWSRFFHEAEEQFVEEQLLEVMQKLKDIQPAIDTPTSYQNYGRHH